MARNCCVIVIESVPWIILNPTKSLPSVPCGAARPARCPCTRYPPTDRVELMDPRRLVIFSTVVERGSIGAAARELGWTQPAVSQHLAALEKETGMQLLLRSSGGVTPTEAGARLVVHADRISESMDAALAELEEIAALKKGRVRFACFPSAAAIILPPALADMNASYPDIDLSFTELEPPDAIAGVLANQFDVAMIFRYAETPVEEEGALEWTPILADPMRLVLPPSHRLADRESVSL